MPLHTPFETIYIIYNPNSTGDSKKNAKILKQNLDKKIKKQKITKLIATKYAGHAQKLAKKWANSGKKILIISSSGDGGYNEIVNGVMDSPKAASMVSICLIPSGNANDHYHAVKTDALLDHICQGITKKMDILCVQSTLGNKPWKKYAHSYAGIGFSAEIGKKLTASDLNYFNEKWIVLRGLLRFNFTEILLDNSKQRISSLVVSNIGHMSKLLQLSNEYKIDDGKMELYIIPYKNKLHTLKTLMMMLVKTPNQSQSIERLAIKSKKSLVIQLDGEDYTIDGNKTLTFKVCKQAISYVS